MGGYRKRRQELDEIEAYLSLSQMGARKAEALMATLQEARLLDQRLLDDDEARLKDRRELPSE